jgi:hypothetical protein
MISKRADVGLLREQACKSTVMMSPAASGVCEGRGSFVTGSPKVNLHFRKSFPRNETPSCASL